MPIFFESLRPFLAQRANPSAACGKNRSRLPLKSPQTILPAALAQWAAAAVIDVRQYLLDHFALLDDGNELQLAAAFTALNVNVKYAL